MTKKNQMHNFSSDLILWYKENKRDLPWRQTSDVYKVWASEIILQQTRVNQGLSYYLNFLKHFPSVFELAAATEDEVLKCWEGLGYYSRARNMHATAKHVSHNLNGVFPKDYNGLLELKGIGSYTAAAISSICYNEHRTVVDGNVFRVLSRLFGIETPINTSNGKKQIEELAHSLNNVNNHGEFNQALMEFGALHCTPKQPGCDSCIFNNRCWAHLNNKADILPVKEKKLKIKKRYMTFLFLKDKNNKTIIQRRSGNDIWKGLYQFPLIENGKQTPAQEILASKELQALIGAQKIQLLDVKEIKHNLTHRQLFIHVLLIQTDTLSQLNKEQYQIIEEHDLPNYAFPKPLSKILDEN